MPLALAFVPHATLPAPVADAPPPLAAGGSVPVALPRQINPAAAGLGARTAASANMLDAARSRARVLPPKHALRITPIRPSTRPISPVRVACVSTQDISRKVQQNEGSIDGSVALMSRASGVQIRRREYRRLSYALAAALARCGIGLRVGTDTRASPSSTTLLSTRHSQRRSTRRPSGTSSATSTLIVTTSPILTGPRKFKVCER